MTDWFEQPTPRAKPGQVRLFICVCVDKGRSGWQDRIFDSLEHAIETVTKEFANLEYEWVGIRNEKQDLLWEQGVSRRT